MVGLARPVCMARDTILGAGIATRGAWERGGPPLRVVMANAAGRVPMFRVPVGRHVAGEAGNGGLVPGFGVGFGGRVAA